ncbi:MATN2 [Branchiostoma lanceolatum]|uniref:MATN2 protein n=1 Tax=Branchiostoma lanceolatum TaxID=7740 RepID=A0A8K0ERJ7_BRALA|nr:MATN2 [Branchiostoma lanceolatum]
MSDFSPFHLTLLFLLLYMEAIHGAEYMGCYVDGSPRVLPYEIAYLDDIKSCGLHCKGNGYIYYATITASSEWAGDHAATNARLDFKEVPSVLAGAWAAAVNDANQWLMFDLGQRSTVGVIRTRGRHAAVANHWVTSYSISYGNSSGDEMDYKDANGNTVVFTGNSDRDSLVTHVLGDYNGPFHARYVKFHPITWNLWISMRADIGEVAPVGFWPLNSHTELRDVSGYGNDATGVGVYPANGVHGEIDGAYSLSGSSASYIEIPNNGMLDTRYSITMLAYVYPTGTDGPIFNYRTDDYGVHLWQIGTNNLQGRMLTREHVYKDIISVSVLNLNEWNFVGMTYSYPSGKVKLWHNGAEVGSLDVGTFETETDYDIRVGVRDGDSRTLAGRIACLQIYNIPLNGEQIREAAARCKDIDECATNNGGCSMNCNNTIGSFECFCAVGYVLDGDGVSCKDVDECASNNGGCKHTCTNTVGSFQCSCNSGFTLNSNNLACDDTDECATSNGGCSINCNNTIGSFECFCAVGYVLDEDGVSCKDVDECASNNGGCEQNCTNTDTVGSFQCSCDPGFTLNSKNLTCDDTDECATNNGGCTMNCNNTIGSFECFCADGYVLDGDGVACKDTDECATNNGGCSMNCNNTIGHFECFSADGYVLDGDGVSCQVSTVMPTTTSVTTTPTQPSTTAEASTTTVVRSTAGADVPTTTSTTTTPAPITTTPTSNTTAAGSSTIGLSTTGTSVTTTSAPMPSTPNTTSAGSTTVVRSTAGADVPTTSISTTPATDTTTDSNKVQSTAGAAVPTTSKTATSASNTKVATSSTATWSTATSAPTTLTSDASTEFNVTELRSTAGASVATTYATTTSEPNTTSTTPAPNGTTEASVTATSSTSRTGETTTSAPTTLASNASTEPNATKLRSTVAAATYPQTTPKANTTAAANTTVVSPTTDANVTTTSAPTTPASNATTHADTAVMTSTAGVAITNTPGRVNRHDTSVAALVRVKFAGGAIPEEREVATVLITAVESSTLAIRGVYVTEASIDINECMTGAHVCIRGELCVNRKGSYACASCYPDIALVGGGENSSTPVDIKRRVPFTVQSTVTVDCNVAYSFLFNWSLYSMDDGLPSSKITLPENVETTGSEITLPKNVLPYGKVVIRLEFTVEETLSGLRVVMFAERWVNVLSSALVADIAGGSARSLAPGSDIVLDASFSTDPDSMVTNSADFTYSWTCVTEIGTSCDDLFSDGGTGQSYVIPSDDVNVETSVGWLTVHLSVWFPGRSAGTTSQILQFFPVGSPSIYIRCFSNCNRKINPSEKLVLVSECSNCEENEQVSYNWTLQEAPDDFGRSDLDWDSESTTGRNLPDVVIKPEVFTALGDYVFRVEMTVDDGRQGFAEYSFVPNESPVVGSCTVSPENGTAMVTEFIITCTGFTDTDEPLTYTFFFNSGTDSTFSTLYIGTEPTTPPQLFPVGQEPHDYVVRIRVEVSDSFGAISLGETSVQVLALPAEQSTAVASQLVVGENSPLTKLMRQGDAKSLVQMSNSVTSVLNSVRANASAEAMKAATQAREAVVTALTTIKPTSVSSVNLVASALGSATIRGDEVSADARVATARSLQSMGEFLKSLPPEDLEITQVERTSSVMMAASLERDIPRGLGSTSKDNCCN